ncbi:MAG: aspartate carbamoyltransferase [Leptonema sp. (in: Bacteria)]|nr:aspartate carbamoyltransferase [Leptonema sp. (in: bacteria)]
MNVSLLHPLLKEPVHATDGIRGIEKPLALMNSIEEDPAPLMRLANRHIVSIRQFSYETILQLFRLAAMYETQPVPLHRPLGGKLLISAFYEPSTRTRISFESAWHRLGGDIMSITDRATTGMAKGESLKDIAEMFSNYGDVMVLRDNHNEAVYEMLPSLRIPIINAGNGIDEHPTQAMADLYTILKWRPDLVSEATVNHKIKIGIIGTPARMRTVRSLLLILTLFHYAIDEVVVINPDKDIFDKGQLTELEQSGLKIRQVHALRENISDLDVVYINSIAWIGDSFERLADDMKLSIDLPLKPGSIVLHPLARGDELSEDLDSTPYNWYFAQARGAVFLRMALLTCLVRRVGEVIDDRTFENGSSL